MLSELSRKILSEMKQLGSAENDSILKNAYTIEALKYLDWERVWIEFQKRIPTLTTLLSHLVPRPSDNIPVICITQILKSRHMQLGLVQRALSIMLYSHGTSKEVSMYSVKQFGERHSCTLPDEALFW